MTRAYSLVMEATSTGHSAYVAELPTVLVTGRTAGEVVYLEEMRAEQSPTAVVREMTSSCQPPRRAKTTPAPS